jgi:hypothetical protein
MLFDTKLELNLMLTQISKRLFAHKLSVAGDRLNVVSPTDLEELIERRGFAFL